MICNFGSRHWLTNVLAFHDQNPDVPSFYDYCGVSRDCSELNAHVVFAIILFVAHLDYIVRQSPSFIY